MTDETEKEAAMLSPDTITGWHAHVYFDAGTREPAQQVRDAVEAGFDIEMGRWHEKMVGPHPRWSYQIAFKPEIFSTLIPWLGLNRRGLTIFIHPETDDVLADHEHHAIWMGELLPLKLDIFKKADA